MRAGRLAAAAVICLGATTVGAAAHAQDVGDELTIEEMQLLDAAYRSTRDVERIDRSTSTVLGEPADVEGPVLAAGSRYTAVEPEDIVRYLEVISEAARVASSPGPIEVLSTGSAAYFSTTVGGTIVTIVTPEPTSACDAGFVYQEFAVFWAIDGLPVVAPVDGYVDPGRGGHQRSIEPLLGGELRGLSRTTGSTG